MNGSGGGQLPTGMIEVVRMTIIGTNPPGRTFCRPDGSIMDNVHVGVQVRGEPAELTAADEEQFRWEVGVDVIVGDDRFDFRGPAIQGRRGDRFVYLTWGDVGLDGRFEMFRRAKLMLDRVDAEVMAAAVETGRLEGRVDLTGGDGGPRCARVDPPAIGWSAGHPT